jgi:hypothetical protein
MDATDWGRGWGRLAAGTPTTGVVYVAGIESRESRLTIKPLLVKGLSPVCEVTPPCAPCIPPLTQSGGHVSIYV